MICFVHLYVGTMFIMYLLSIWIERDHTGYNQIELEFERKFNADRMIYLLFQPDFGFFSLLN